MIKARHIEVLLSVDDLAAALSDLAAGKAERIQVRCEEGAMRISLDAVVETVRSTVPVELLLRLRAVRPEDLTFDVEWTNMAVVPRALKEMVLERAFDQLPGQYEAGVFTLPLLELLEELPMLFTLSDVSISADGCRVRLSNAVLFPVTPEPIRLPAVVPQPSDTEHEVTEHQDFYRRLRQKATSFAGKKVPRWAQPLVPWLLAIPDFFVLALRLARDGRVPAKAKMLAAAIVLYFVSPIDIIPDVIPVMGQVDDIALALFAIESMGRSIPPGVIQELWPGEGDVLTLVGSGISLFTQMLPRRVLMAIRRWLKRNEKQ